MDPIGTEAIEAVRAAADAVPGYRGTLTEVRRRVRRRRNRRVALSAAAVATVLATAGIGVATQRPVRENPTAPAGVRGDRLILGGASGTYRTAQGGTVELNAFGGLIGELLPGGELVVHRAAGMSTCPGAVALQTGGFAAMCLADLEHSVSPGGPPPGVTWMLVVTGADGATRIRREVRREGETVDLLTATETTAYLWRPAGLVAHDLATGAEEPVITAAALGVTDPPGDEIEAADLSGERLVMARKEDGCAITVLDGPSGAESVRLPLGVPGCERVAAVRLSPNGDMAAVTYWAQGLAYAVRVLRLADGTVLAKADGAALTPVAGAPPGFDRLTAPSAVLAWQDDHTLRGVAYRSGVPDVHDLDQFTLTW